MKNCDFGSQLFCPFPISYFCSSNNFTFNFFRNAIEQTAVSIKYVVIFVLQQQITVILTFNTIKEKKIFGISLSDNIFMVLWIRPQIFWLTLKGTRIKINKNDESCVVLPYPCHLFQHHWLDQVIVGRWRVVRLMTAIHWLLQNRIYKSNIHHSISSWWKLFYLCFDQFHIA